ncbi:MAG: VOC family protein, partial [Candidatus Hodarchaeales archaeon]
MLDHIVINVSNLERSKTFYLTTLAPLNYVLLKEFEEAASFGVTVGHGKCMDPGGDFWIAKGIPQSPRIHFAFSAVSRSGVNDFYNRALAAGGKNNGRPGLRTKYHEHYYA